MKIRFYEMYDQGHLVGTFTRQDIQALFGIPHTSVTRAASSGERVHKKYTFKCVKTAKEIERQSMKSWAKEWDSVRTQILKKVIHA